VTEAPLLYLIAGEPSGDFLGARLMAALKAEAALRFAGVGGPRMAAEGLESLFPIDELALMGLAEVLPHVPSLLWRIAKTVADIRRRRPAAVVTIDSSGFTWRVARRVRQAGKPPVLIHYVAPMVWAWRPGRAREVARRYDLLLTLLPFEPPYFEAVGLDCAFVGHPVIESGADGGDGAGFRWRHDIAPEAPLLTVLPGSRRNEALRLLPVFGAAVGLLAARYPGLRVVVPTLDPVAATVNDAISTWPGAPIVVEAEDDKFDAFAASDAALAASGTVALELAMARLPSVVAYRINRLTHAVVRRMVTVRYANLVNLLLDRAAVPELIQDDCTPERLADAVSRLLDDDDACRDQLADYDRAVELLGYGGPAPSQRAARQVLAAMAQTANR
jgi:lipid-A-disaccharide synthase